MNNVLSSFYVTEFLNHCQRQTDVYDTDTILVTMGGDFNYQGNK